MNWRRVGQILCDVLAWLFALFLIYAALVNSQFAP